MPSDHIKGHIATHWLFWQLVPDGQAKKQVPGGMLHVKQAEPPQTKQVPVRGSHVWHKPISQGGTQGVLHALFSHVPFGQLAAVQTHPSLPSHSCPGWQVETQAPLTQVWQLPGPSQTSHVPLSGSHRSHC
jgi:hypothetical protein